MFQYKNSSLLPSSYNRKFGFQPNNSPYGQTLTPTLSHRRGSSSGFTLAETLIALVIVGVVAALTVPTMIAKYHKEQTVTRLKKTYSALSQTTARAVSDNGPISTWELGRKNNRADAKVFFDKYMAPYLSLMGESKEIPSIANELCHYLNGSICTDDANAYSKAYLADGTSLTFNINESSENNHQFKIVIDINGDKKPNVYGKDIFQFKYYISFSDPTLVGRFVPNGFDNTRQQLLSNSNYQCNKNKQGFRCAALIIKDGWQIKDDYPW